MRQHFYSSKRFINNSRQCKYHYPRFYRWLEYNILSHCHESFWEISGWLSFCFCALNKKTKRKHSDEQPLEHNYFKLQSTYIGQCEFPGYKKMRRYGSTCSMWYSCPRKTEGEWIRCVNYMFFISSFEFHTHDLSYLIQTFIAMVIQTVTFNFIFSQL